MTHTKNLLAALGAIGAAALLAGCAGSTASGTTSSGEGDDWSAIEPVELTVSSIFPASSTASILLDEWMTAVTEATDGAVTFDYYGDGTLHPAPEAISALTSGLTDITFVSNGTFPDQLPISNWDDVVVQSTLSSFGYPNMNVAGLAQQVIHYSEGNVALPEMEAAGFTPLLPMLSGPAALTCSKPFATPEDLEGRQVRVPNAVAQGENEALGMVGVFTPPNEQYEALQRGVIDCAVNAPTTVLSGGLLEVSPYVAFTNNAPSSGANWVISTTTLDSLPPQVQEILFDTRYDAFTNFAINTLDQYSEIVTDTEAAGGEIVDAAELNPLIAEYWAGRPSLASSAPSGIDAEASIALTERVANAWWDFSIDELQVPVDDPDILDVLNRGSDIIEWAPWTEALTDQLGAAK
ncbi:TRAP transporter substrate-binding protein [Agromyces aerolatus]|uniref:TRAP transporter substrate-binding protein n=1 Tax=Agromyces sp. LY-1074 TaxID=3074080 RepID=UPI00286552E3|nr:MULTISPECIES: TRAP transporter substrate-binding protein DctP [unclassified Agromyces]MDR5699113.1 TRAP transporter substrate-binding protein DctP [Agromyces sp. LY-1074]MDR5705108.1 TRAP transporter substrate-binding protein DctP [Agromyces sp. LY-1358]